MTLPTDLKTWTKRVLRQYQLQPGQNRGQHFLIDQQVLTNIITAAQLTSKDKVLEIGGGLGTLTLTLLEQCGLVVTVEVDNKLAAGLEKYLPASPCLRVIRKNILKMKDSDILKALELKTGESFSIVANLPYDISGAFLRKFLTSELPINQLVLLLQKEVAERLAAQPGQTSLLTLLAQLAGHAEIKCYISPSSFYPPPQVKSALIKIMLYSKIEQDELLAGVSPDWLWQLARVGFAARRKLLLNNLASGLIKTRSELEHIFADLGIPRQARAQELSLNQWINLARYLRLNQPKFSHK
ncbi:MAG: 16S rRNA (adenine(1518)-N(6)/adenine(1519)-N(6))-dimethyltransferase RsmA [Patescibacteria group bacterium]